MGKNLKVALGATGLLLTLSLINGGKLFYLLMFLILGIIGISALVLRSNVKLLISAFYINERVVHVGDSLLIEYKLANNSLLPIALAWAQIRISKNLGNMVFDPEVLFFRPLQLITIKKDLVASHRGYYQVGSLQVTLSDPFNLMVKEVTYGKDIDLTVYPKVVELVRINLKPSEFFGSIRVSENTHEDFTSIRNIRNYQYGDSIKRIHWKQSAKNNKLLVKEFDLSANTKVSIILDGYKGTQNKDGFEAIEEKLVETCASLSKYFLRNDIESNVLLSSKNHVRLSGKNIDQLEDVLKELIGFASDGEVDIYKVFASEYKKMTFGSTLYVLTSDINNMLVDAYIAAARKSIRVSIIIVVSPHYDIARLIDIQEMLRTHSVDLYIIYSDQDIRQVLEA